MLSHLKNPYLQRKSDFEYSVHVQIFDIPDEVAIKVSRISSGHIDHHPTSRSHMMRQRITEREKMTAPKCVNPGVTARGVTASNNKILNQRRLDSDAEESIERGVGRKISAIFLRTFMNQILLAMHCKISAHFLQKYAEREGLKRGSLMKSCGASKEGAAGEKDLMGCRYWQSIKPRALICNIDKYTSLKLICPCAGLNILFNVFFSFLLLQRVGWVVVEILAPGRDWEGHAQYDCQI